MAEGRTKGNEKDKVFQEQFLDENGLWRCGEKTNLPILISTLILCVILQIYWFVNTCTSKNILSIKVNLVPSLIINNTQFVEKMKDNPIVIRSLANYLRCVSKS